MLKGMCVCLLVISFLGQGHYYMHTCNVYMYTSWYPQHLGQCLAQCLLKHLKGETMNICQSWIQDTSPPSNYSLLPKLIFAKFHAQSFN